ncbi:hypothetical protein [Paractinoplanes atraurantiacus]|uniref:Uncharacterized protein n=1 Tax=Paractinoplanes atraurantiacus TaxID=1036182 RepID=A0A285J2E9_9ACTN|nr:hypothetical protein [Actinoplanes atraurantiacus]SNY54479.1 hypothetical protein SAMN05421748_11583 [Actinoplanes atraurantiacus]
MSPVAVAWIDRQYDRENGGRFAEHVLAGAKEFAGCWGDISPVGFACVAWGLATAPRLDPGYVRLHRRVLAADCVRNEWDGSLTVQVRLVAPWPEALAGDQVWQQDRGWRGWPETFGQFLQPSQEELSRVPHVRSALLVDAPVQLGALPPVPDGPGPAMVDLAERAVTVLVREVNDLLGPMLTRLEA